MVLSIHAPTRGATYPQVILQMFLTLSIHAPTRGATSTIFFTSSLFFSFNPRSYKRSDEGSDKVNLLTQIFQSTLLQEERLYIYLKYLLRLFFQSTLLQEERLYKNHLHLIINLSIHAPTRGATPTDTHHANPNLLSIHAPTRGATTES